MESELVDVEKVFLAERDSTKSRVNPVLIIGVAPKDFGE
jgi:hypothetical protein